MAFFPGCKIENVNIDSIDLNNTDFKISRPQGDGRLKESIGASGILEMPVLFKNNGEYKIIFGHNRLAIFRELKYPEPGLYVLCYVAEVPDPDLYINNAVLKNFRGEIGPVGKCRFIRVLNDTFTLNRDGIAAAAKRVQIPDDFLYSGNTEKVLSLPEQLKNYFDLKNIGFKIIKKILSLSGDSCRLLSDWSKHADIRVNIFKGIVDLMSDIDRMNKSNNIPVKVSGIDQAAAGTDDYDKGPARKDEMLFREIFKVRYPEYTAIRSEAKKIISDLSKDGLEIDFPEYFEKDEFGIGIKINKRSNIGGFNRIVSGINRDALKRLLDLL